MDLKRLCLVADRPLVLNCKLHGARPMARVGQKVFSHFDRDPKRCGLLMALLVTSERDPKC